MSTKRKRTITDRSGYKNNFSAENIHTWDELIRYANCRIAAADRTGSTECTGARLIRYATCVLPVHGNVTVTRGDRAAQTLATHTSARMKSNSKAHLHTASS